LNNNISTPQENKRPFLFGTFAALKHYNYRLYFIGMTISMMGTWMQTTAQGYFIYQLTNSTTYLGLVAFMGGISTWVFTLFGGAVADRISRWTLIVITQTFMMILAFILAALTFTNAVQPWHLLILAFLLGVANAFDIPARISFVLELVSRDDMTNAIAWNSTVQNIAALAGPAVAGLIYTAFGAAWCFTLNGISFIAMIIALFLMRIGHASQDLHSSNSFAVIADGLRYIFSSRLTLTLTGAVGLINVFCFGLLNLLPAWVTDVLHGDEVTNGLLFSARGFGALICALILAYLVKFKIRGKLWITGFLVTPVALFIFALVRWIPLSLVMMVVIGWSMMMTTNNANALIQSEVPDALRGRVTSFFVLVFNGAIPIGALLGGVAVEHVGAPLTIMVSAVILMLFSLVAWFYFPDIRQNV
jgi:predicted MFS family arabinose efflux permease